MIYEIWWNFFYDLFFIKNVADVNSIDSFVSKRNMEPKPKRKRPNEVIDFLKIFMETQQKRYDDEVKRKEQMHKERIGIVGGFFFGGS